MSAENWLTDEAEAVEELRKLRNDAASLSHDHESRTELTEKFRAQMDSVETCLDSWVEKKSVVPIRVLLQFLGNLSVQFDPGRKLSWNFFESTKKLGSLLKSEDSKIRSYTAMCLHSCLKNTEIQSAFLRNHRLLVEVLTDSIPSEETDCEWSLYILQDLWRTPGFKELILNTPFKNVPGTISLLLDVAHSLWEEETCPAKVPPIPAQNIETLARWWNSEETSITVSPPTTLEWMKREPDWDYCSVTVFRKILEFLLQITAQDVAPIDLATQHSIIKTAGKHLVEIWKLGKEGPDQHPLWTVNTNLNELAGRNPTGPTALNHGLKSDLILLIANCSGSDETSRLIIRDSGMIPALLDSSPPDANNPFITQRVIFAVKNLCKSPEIRTVLDGIRLNGSAPDNYDLGLTPAKKFHPS